MILLLENAGGKTKRKPFITNFPLKNSQEGVTVLSSDFEILNSFPLC